MVCATAPSGECVTVLVMAVISLGHEHDSVTNGVVITGTQDSAEDVFTARPSGSIPY